MFSISPNVKRELFPARLRPIELFPTRLPPIELFPPVPPSPTSDLSLSSFQSPRKRRFTEELRSASRTTAEKAQKIFDDSLLPDQEVFINLDNGIEPIIAGRNPPKAPTKRLYRS